MRACYLVLLQLTFIGCQADNQRPSENSDRGIPELGKISITHYGCGSCHTIPGIRNANGLVGPSLETIARRSYVAGVLQNTRSNMIRWIQNPPAVDDKTAMPNLHVTDTDALNIAAYLYTLR
jgi:cytochrome c